MKKTENICEKNNSKSLNFCEDIPCTQINSYIESILNTVQDGVYITDGKSKTIFLNNAYEKISGTKKELFLNKTMTRIIEEGLIDKSGTMEALNSKKEITMNQTLNNKNQVLITSTPLFDLDGNINLVVTTVRDVTLINSLKNELNRTTLDMNKLKSLIHEKDGIVYQSKQIENTILTAKKVAVYDTSVLISGETGVGKDIVARIIHKNSNRANKPFIDINCSAIPESLMESELFGYEGGSFTGALTKGKKGIFELANGGTLFLDEIGELSLNMQAKFLKTLQNKTIRKIGGSKEIPIDVRIVSATNQDLKSMIEEKKFRDDLYYRINIIPIEILPLRKRREDILLLVNHFLEKSNEINHENKFFSKEALLALYNYDFPGNVRELKNLVERSVVLSRDDEIQLNDLPTVIKISDFQEKSFELKKGVNFKQAVDNFEKMVIKNALDNSSTSKEAAIKLGMNESTLTRKKQKLGII